MTCWTFQLKAQVSGIGNRVYLVGIVLQIEANGFLIMAKKDQRNSQPTELSDDYTCLT